MVINELQTGLPKLNILQFLEKHYEEAFYEVAKLVRKNNGSFEDAKDILHDAIIILLQHRADGKEINSELLYLMGISKHLLLSKIRTGKKMKSLEELSHDSFFSEEKMAVRSTKLLEFILRTGKRCMDLLTKVYMEKLSMKDIANEFGFTSEHSASVQKYKCIEKIRNTIKSKNLEYEDFFE
jgi:DNA-directed RNA polymerase specialized sigma24 family protein